MLMMTTFLVLRLEPAVQSVVMVGRPGFPVVGQVVEDRLGEGAEEGAEEGAKEGAEEGAEAGVPVRGGDQTWKSYGDPDVGNDIPTFQPTRPPGLHFDQRTLKRTMTTASEFFHLFLVQKC
jgi:hypothetical protein